VEGWDEDPSILPIRGAAGAHRGVDQRSRTGRAEEEASEAEEEMTDEAKAILDAIKSVTPITDDTEFEGDRNGWHIRLAKRVGEIETWQLFHGDEPESSPAPKSVVLEWLEDETSGG
jgi:hypothetical protein